jgi:hypothetical protein
MPPAPLVLPISAPLTVSASLGYEFYRRGNGDADWGLRGGQWYGLDRKAPRVSKPAQVKMMIRIDQPPMFSP